MKYAGWFSSLSLATLLPLPALAQSAYPLQLATSGTRFTEHIVTRITTQTTGGNILRDVVRHASFLLRLSGDTVVVKADSLTLSERGSDISRDLDTDGFVGGGYKLFLTPSGAAKVVSRPFVPDYLTQVSDLEMAMESFFPLKPPTLVVGARGPGAVGRQWDRLADSAGKERYHYRERVTVDTTRTVADTVHLSLQQSTDEEGWVVWDRTLGPLAWRKNVVSNSTAKVRGQIVRTKVEQQVNVER